MVQFFEVFWGGTDSLKVITESSLGFPRIKTSNILSTEKSPEKPFLFYWSDVFFNFKKYVGKSKIICVLSALVFYSFILALAFL